MHFRGTTDVPVFGFLAMFDLGIKSRVDPFLCAFLTV